VFSTFGLLT
jgi:hypothetical protein